MPVLGGSGGRRRRRRRRAMTKLKKTRILPPHVFPRKGDPRWDDQDSFSHEGCDSDGDSVTCREKSLFAWRMQEENVTNSWSKVPQTTMSERVSSELGYMGLYCNERTVAKRWREGMEYGKTTADTTLESFGGTGIILARLIRNGWCLPGNGWPLVKYPNRRINCRWQGRGLTAASLASILLLAVARVRFEREDAFDTHCNV
ncbi:hypothetical protein DMN91_010581 [Ooceraea biroi]|uniref:Uncharacterized protein n=1 Tax=Ooceraea biroi TaxID=2015173 RepID=A0A3L8D8T8_OOCBI|nr:uncharacterized protein LOC105288244 [Ooceraea biroi]RLU16513.1 hypothetical protein DMN91_010581 [Ooceraea biroi]